MQPVKELVKDLIVSTPAARLPLALKRDALTILCFHGVTRSERFGATANYEGRHIHRDNFARTLELLLRWLTPITLAQLDAFYSEGRPLPPNPLFVTFDDGFANNHRQAFPVLKELGCPATIFLATGLIGNETGFWVEKLEFAFHRTSKTEFRGWPLRTAADRELGFRALLRELKGGLSLEAVDEGARKACEELGFGGLDVIEGNEDYRFLTWDEVREMAASGITFGSHTVSHANLNFESDERARRELRESKARIETELDVECAAFCYPFGRSGHSDRTRRLVQEAGYRLNFQLGGALNDKATDPLLLNRIPLGWDSRRESLLWHIVRS